VIKGECEDAHCLGGGWWGCQCMKHGCAFPTCRYTPSTKEPFIMCFAKGDEVAWTSLPKCLGKGGGQRLAGSRECLY